MICFGERAPGLPGLTSYSSPVYGANVHAWVLGCFSHVRLFANRWTITHQANVSYLKLFHQYTHPFLCRYIYSYSSTSYQYHLFHEAFLISELNLSFFRVPVIVLPLWYRSLHFLLDILIMDIPLWFCNKTVLHQRKEIMFGSFLCSRLELEHPKHLTNCWLNVNSFTQ